MYVGKKVTRVDAYDKVIGRTKYTDDLSPCLEVPSSSDDADTYQQ